jgi:hypothetical protein
MKRAKKSPNRAPWRQFRRVNSTSSLPDITNHSATVFWLLSGMASCFISGLPAFGTIKGWMRIAYLWCNPLAAVVKFKKAGAHVKTEKALHQM